MKLSQQKYITEAPTDESDSGVSDIDKVENLTISNKLKGILSMEYDKKEKKLMVIENVWKKLVEEFPGALAIPKYGKQ